MERQPLSDANHNEILLFFLRPPGSCCCCCLVRLVGAWPVARLFPPLPRVKEEKVLIVLRRETIVALTSQTSRLFVIIDFDVDCRTTSHLPAIERCLQPLAALKKGTVRKSHYICHQSKANSFFALFFFLFFSFDRLSRE